MATGWFWFESEAASLVFLSLKEYLSSILFYVVKADVFKANWFTDCYNCIGVFLGLACEMHHWQVKKAEPV